MNWADGFTPRGICSFGITEGLAALGGLIGIGGAEAGAGAGLAELGAGAVEGGVAGGEATASLGLGELAGGGAAGGAADALGGGAAGGLGGFGGDAAALPSASGGLGSTSEVAALSGTGPTSAGTFGATGGSSIDALSSGGGVGGGTAGGAAGGSSAATSGGSIFDKLVSGIKNSPIQAAGVGIGAAGLGYNIYKGSQQDANSKALTASAGQLNAQGQQLASYLASGTLPPGLQAAVTKASDAAKARIIQNHAHNGMPTDPSQNSALAQELNNVDQQAVIQAAQIGQQLLTTGVNEIGLSDQLYAQLIGINRQQSADTGKAIGNFAAALVGTGNNQRKAA